ncbi:E4 ubiquitin-protein ligase UFD2 [Pseudozyma hubeiensis]|nr:E4 ubiquitin-protein ligase UFD2 [Pseudozyma hubeiensis]
MMAVRATTGFHSARRKIRSSTADTRGVASGGSNGGGYTITSTGTNSQGNHYCSRDYGSGASNGNS